MRILSIRLPKELDHQLQKIAHELDTTRSELARQVIAGYLKSLAPGREASPAATAEETPAPAESRKPRAPAEQT